MFVDKNSNNLLLDFINKESGQHYESLDGALNNISADWLSRTMVADIWIMMKKQQADGLTKGDTTFITCASADACPTIDVFVDPGAQHARPCKIPAQDSGGHNPAGDVLPVD